MTEETIRGRIEYAIDLLAERTQGNPARSASHNARLMLESLVREIAAADLISEAQKKAGQAALDSIVNKVDEDMKAVSHNLPPSDYDEVLESVRKHAGDAYRELLQRYRFRGKVLERCQNDFRQLAGRVEKALAALGGKA